MPCVQIDSCVGDEWDGLICHQIFNKLICHHDTKFPPPPPLLLRSLFSVLEDFRRWHCIVFNVFENISCVSFFFSFLATYFLLSDLSLCWNLLSQITHIPKRQIEAISQNLNNIKLTHIIGSALYLTNHQYNNNQIKMKKNLKRRKKFKNLNNNHYGPSTLPFLLMTPLCATRSHLGDPSVRWLLYHPPPVGWRHHCHVCACR